MGTTATSEILYGDKAVGARVGTSVGLGVGPVDATTEAVVATAAGKPAALREVVTAPAASAAVSWLVSDVAVVVPPPGYVTDDTQGTQGAGTTLSEGRMGEDRSRVPPYRCT
jgi:hypothetical protein